MQIDYLIDTQILSYRFKGVDLKNSWSSGISSVTAIEFLVAQAKKEDAKPDYYVIHPAKYHNILTSDVEPFKNPKRAKRGNRRTDQLIIEFNNEFPTYVDYGHQAIAEIINSQDVGFFKLSIAHLPKEKQKYLMQRLMYIIENGIVCYTLDKDAIEIGLDLFYQFKEKHNPKGNIKNTLNDIFILSTAIQHNLRLFTEDRLLNRFSAEVYQVEMKQEDANLVVIDFYKADEEKSSSQESKGYINNGWRYALKNRIFPA